MWKRLDHKNIVPLLGITTAPLQLVSKWMPDGNLMEYVGKHSNTNRHDLLSDIAEGLHFLHSRNIIHGDLKGPNILIDGGGRARIADFGLATVTRNLDSVRSPSDDHGHTVRWAAPEVLRGEPFTTATDVFSFAMIMIEVRHTSAVPVKPWFTAFPDRRRYLQVPLPSSKPNPPRLYVGQSKANAPPDQHTRS